MLYCCFVLFLIAKLDGKRRDMDLVGVWDEYHEMHRMKFSKNQLTGEG